MAVDTAGSTRHYRGIVGNDADDSGDGGEPKASTGRPNRRLTDRLRPGPSAPAPDGTSRPLATSRYAAGASSTGGDSRPLSVPPPASTPSPDSWRAGSRKTSNEPLSSPPPSTGAPPSSRRSGSASSPESNRRAGQRKLAAESPVGEPLSIPPPSTGAPPSSRRAGLRKLAVDPPPPSAPPESDLPGRVHRLVAWCDAHKGSFFISLVIMQTGIKLREFDATARDDRAVMAKLWPALDGLLTSAELEELRRAIRDPW